MSFSEKIIERRISLNMSQRELAEKLGITPTRLNYWEKGKREPDLHYIKALAKELGVSGDYLLETESEEDISNAVTDIDEHMELYKVLTNRRKELGMKIEDLSRISAVPENTLKKILAGITVNPGITTVKAIVKAMGMTLSELDDQIAVADSLSSEVKIMTIGERIKKARLEKGYTQSQLAEMIGVAKNTITGYETGTREPDAIKINAIAKALNVSGDYLLGTEYNWLPSSEAMKIAHKYDRLDSAGRGLVKMVVDYELERVQPAQPKPMVNPSEAEIAENAKATAALDNAAAGD